MNRTLFRILFLAAMMWPAVVLACSCQSPTLHNRYNNNAYVLTVVFTEVAPVDEQNKSYKFEVTEHIKGSRSGNEFITNRSTSLCGAQFLIGREYLLFLNSTNKKIAPCSGGLEVGRRIPESTLQKIRDYRDGKRPDLHPSWAFTDNSGLCTLHAFFQHVDDPHIRYNTIRFQYRYAYAPNQRKLGNPQALPGYTATRVKLMHYAGKVSGNLTLVSDKQSFPATWTQNSSGRGGHYEIDGKQTESLIRALRNSEELSYTGAIRTYKMGGKVQMTYLGDSLERFSECIALPEPG